MHTPAAETEGSQRGIATLRLQLKEARQKVDDAEAAESGDLGALRDRRRDLSLKLNAAREKVRTEVPCEEN